MIKSFAKVEEAIAKYEEDRNAKLALPILGGALEGYPESVYWDIAEHLELDAEQVDAFFGYYHFI
jgi:hypothetical protein